MNLELYIAALPPDHIMAYTPSPKESIAKEIEDLRSQRREIINNIEDFESARVDPTKSGEIESLKDQHNLLLDQEEQLRMQRLSDPLQILPPELWPDVLPVDRSGDLLILTLVSIRWRDGILSNPLLWCNINLDSTQGDYWSHALMGFTLSASLDISLRIRLSLETWKEFAPSIVVEHRRIAFLSISSLSYNEAVSEALEILSDFGELPKLRDLTLPIPMANTRPSLYIRQWDQGRAPFSVEQLSLQNMPSLLNINGAIFTPRHLQMSSVSKFEKITIPSLKLDTVMALKDLLRLHHLYLAEERDPYTAEDIIPSHFYSSLSSVKSLNYRGLFLNRALPFIGYNLRTLDASYVHWNEFPKLLVTLQSFPNLYRLNINLALWHEGLGIPVINVVPLPTVKSFHIGFPIEQMYDEYSEDSKKKHSMEVDQLSQYLTSTFPSVCDFNISGQTLTAGLAKYIQSLQHLQHMSFSTRATDYESPMPFASPHLESVSWICESPSNGVLELLRSPTLLTVYLAAGWSLTYDEPQTQSYRIGTTPSLCTAPEGSMPNLRNLKLFVDYLRWDLSPFGHLTALGLTGPSYGFTGGNIFEQLALNLTICPFLEDISLSGPFMEWDMLIVLLERRNLIGVSGVTHIRSIKLDVDIGYRLLRPLADLVGGRFPHRDSLAEYSIPAIGRLFWDKKIPGCVQCLRTFRPCSFLKGQSGSRIYEGETRLGLDNTSPLDLPSADPPLTPEIARWLSERDSRLREYAQGAELAAKEDMGHLKRPFTCRSDDYAGSMTTITPHYLDGVSFENEFEQ